MNSKEPEQLLIEVRSRWMHYICFSALLAFCLFVASIAIDHAGRRFLVDSVTVASGAFAVLLLIVRQVLRLRHGFWIALSVLSLGIVAGILAAGGMAFYSLVMLLFREALNDISAGYWAASALVASVATLLTARSFAYVPSTRQRHPGCLHTYTAARGWYWEC